MWARGKGSVPPSSEGSVGTLGRIMRPQSLAGTILMVWGLGKTQDSPSTAAWGNNSNLVS